MDLTDMTVNDLKAIGLIITEYDNASHKFKSFASTHEGIAVIREEYLELEANVFQYNAPYSPSVKEEIKKEAVQLGAMALRFLIDCCKED